jgi:hypothetical protein
MRMSIPVASKRFDTLHAGGSVESRATHDKEGTYMAIMTYNGHTIDSDGTKHTVDDGTDFTSIVAAMTYVDGLQPQTPTNEEGK